MQNLRKTRRKTKIKRGQTTKTNQKHCTTIGKQYNHKGTRDPAKADDYNQQNALQNHRTTIQNHMKVTRKQ